MTKKMKIIAQKIDSKIENEIIISEEFDIVELKKTLQIKNKVVILNYSFTCSGDDLYVIFECKRKPERQIVDKKPLQILKSNKRIN